MNIKRRVAALEQQRGDGMFVVSGYPGETADESIARARKDKEIPDDEGGGLIVVLTRFATD